MAIGKSLDLCVQALVSITEMTCLISVSQWVVGGPSVSEAIMIDTCVNADSCSPLLPLLNQIKIKGEESWGFQVILNVR